MQLRDIQYVLAVADHKNFRKAAEELKVSQPALSQLIKRLEDELGVKLFNRQNNYVKLTYAGEVFVQDGRQVLMASKMIEKKIYDIQKMKKGVLNIGASPLYEKNFFSQIYPVFFQQYPEIEIHLFEGLSQKQQEMLSHGKLDFGFVSLPIVSPSLVYENLFIEPIVLAVPRDYSIKYSGQTAVEGDYPVIELSRFKDSMFLMYKKNHNLRDLCIQLCEDAGFTPNIIFESTSCEIIDALVAAGMGVGFVPMHIAMNVKGKCDVVYYRIDNSKAFRTYVIAYNKMTYLPQIAREFIRISREFFRSVKGIITL